MKQSRENLKTWRANKSVRLKCFDYSQHIPCHVIIRTIAGTQPFADERLARLTCETLRALIAELNAYLAAYCLMPDHVHILLSPDKSGLTIGVIIGRFKSLSTRSAWPFGVQGRQWQARFYDHLLCRNEHIMTVARYIYENPDRKGFSPSYEFRWFDSAHSC